jgi:hypothetical protein
MLILLTVPLSGYPFDEMDSQTNTVLRGIADVVPGTPLETSYFWSHHLDFKTMMIIEGLGLVAGIAGLIFAIKAFQEARKAKKEASNAKQAAERAGKFVKIQTVTIELYEVGQLLTEIDSITEFSDAWILIQKISSKVRRITSTFQNESGLSETITALREALDTAQKALNSIRPEAGGSATRTIAPELIYNALQSSFLTIGNLIADLIGLFENRTIKPSDDDVKS